MFYPEHVRIVMEIWPRRKSRLLMAQINNTPTHKGEKSIKIGEQQLKYLITLTAVVLLSLNLVACTGSGNEPPASAIDTPAATIAPAMANPTEFSPTATVTIPGDISVEALGNATYLGILDEAVALVDGRYEGEPFVAGGASRPTITLLPETVTYGDLDGDGQADAAVVLVSDLGGSGTYHYLAVVKSRDGKPANVATALLGDRVQVRSLAIEDGRLLTNLLAHAADDPACCPTLETLRAFRLEGETLIDADQGLPLP